MLKKTIPAIGLALIATLTLGCYRNNPDAPDVGGPSTGLVITKVTAIPDVLPADGVSEARLRLEARLRDGNPLPGRAVAFFVIGFQSSTIVDDPGNLIACPQLSAIGSIRVATDVTDEDGVAWGVYTAGTGVVYGEQIQNVDPNKPFDPCDPSDPLARFHCPSTFWTLIRGKITDPRESESESEIQDDVTVEQYGGLCNPGGTT